MLSTLARWAYSTLLRAATPLYFARLWWRGAREPAYRQHWRERLGFTSAAIARGRLWIHAVSLGETRAAAALVDALRAQRPGLQLLLTHGTATGREAGAALLQDGDAQAWLPYDTPGAVRRFLAGHRPALGVLMETELWPNLLHSSQMLRVPMLLANARLSERSQRKGKQLELLLRPTAHALSGVLAQTEDDAQRLREAGASDVQVLGNLKFDLTPDAAQIARGQAWHAALQRRVVLLASSREGEEASLLAAWRGLVAPRPLLVIVPRHPQRFDEVAALAAAANWQVCRRSQWGDMPAIDAALADVWIGDSLGEMALYYALADVALLGGSFAPLGGHNLIEAAACGCPLFMGEHTFNFAQAADMAIAAGAAARVLDMAEGVRRAVALSADAQRSIWAQRATRFAAAHRGAAERMAREVLRFMPAPLR